MKTLNYSNLISFSIKNSDAFIWRSILLISLLSLFGSNSFAQKRTQYEFYNGTGDSADFDQTFTVPACVTSITVEVWGGSGGGFGVTGTSGGGGGGGGAYARSVLAVTPNTTYNLHLGTPGIMGTPGGDSWFDNPTRVLAKGGASSSSGTGGAGGDAGTSIGDVTFSGGNGGNYNDDGGGGGGASGSSMGNGAVGGDGVGDFGGAGGIGQHGLGNGGAGGSDNAPGIRNFSCFGCGGGGGSGTNGTSGGLGSTGFIRVTIPPLVYATLAAPQTICPGNAPANLATTASGGASTNYTYAWEASTTDSTSGFAPLGGTTANLTPPSINTTTWYRAIVGEGTCTPDTTNTVQVFVATLSGTTSFPQTICTGNTPSPLSVTPYPANTPATYSWESSTTGPTSGFTAIGGATANTYTPGGPLNNTIWYRTVLSAPGCTPYTTTAVDAVASNAVATAYAGRPNTTIYSTNTYTLNYAAVGGSVTGASWSITNSTPAGNHTLSTTGETNRPSDVTFTPETGFVGEVQLTLTASNNGCNPAVATKTITVLPSYELDEVFSTAGDYTWTVPACVSSATVQTWGAGGGGGGAERSRYDGGGGGGGGFSSKVIQVKQGEVYDLSVGKGGRGNGFKGLPGEMSWFQSPFTVMALGGGGGLRTNDREGEDGSGGVGGQAYAGYGDVKYSGGNGGRGGNWPGGGGGASAGWGGNGGDGMGIDNGWPNRNNDTITPGGIPPAGGAQGGGGSSSNGGPGIGGDCTVDTAEVGRSPGGGGGGGTFGCNFPGRSGADGQVRIVWGPAIPVFIDLTVSPSATVCLGETVTIKAETEFPVHYSWSTGQVASPTTMIDSIVVTPTATGSITYTLTDLNNCGSDVVQTIWVNTRPTFSITNDTICEGETATITASGANTYSWSNGDATPSINVSPSVTTTYTVTGATNSCDVTDVARVVVNGSPTIPVTSATTCSGTAATITASGAVSYTWSTGETTPAYTVANPTATTTYTVTGSTADGCQGNGTGTITVDPLPTATIGGTIGVCRNAASPDVTFTGANGIPPYTFTYTINGGANQTVVSNGAGIAMVAAPTDSAGTFTYDLVSVQNSGLAACLNTAIGSAIITINPAPGATITGGTEICKNGPAPAIVFTGTQGNAPYDFTYNINGGADMVVSTTGTSNTVSISPSTANAGVEKYNLTQVQDVNASTCGFANDNTTVTVNELPTATITGTAAVCKLATSPEVTFTGANGIAPYIFTYTINGGAALTATSDGTGVATVAAPTDPTGVFTYSLIGVQDASTTNCLNNVTGSAVITIHPAPGATITGDATICKNSASPDVVFAGLLGNAPYTFTYNINGGANQTVTSAGTDATVSIAAPTGVVGDFKYNLINVQDANLTTCGFTNDDITVKINELPTASITATPSICETDNGTVTFTGADGVAPYTFTYNVNGGATQSISTTSGNTTTITMSDVPGNYVYTLEDVTDANTCNQVQTTAATIVIDALPTATAGPTQTLCENASVLIAGSTLTNGTPTWSHDGTGSITNGMNTLVPTYAAAAGDKGKTVTFTLTVESNNACNPQTATATTTMQIDSLPTATAGTVSNICVNGRALVTGASLTSGIPTWTSSGLGVISNDNTLTPTYNPSINDTSTTVTLTLTVTSNNTCGTQTASDSTTTDIHPLPFASAGGSTTICENATATVGGTSASNGSISWMHNGAGSLSNTNTIFPTYTAVTADRGNAVQLTMTITSVNSCVGFTDTASYIVNIDKLPTALSGNSTAICEQDTYTLAAGEATGLDGIISWTESGIGTLSGGTTETPSYVSAVGDAGNPVILTMTVASNNACVGATDSAKYTINIRPLLEAQVRLSAAEVCQNAPAQVIFETDKGSKPPYTISYTENGVAGQITTIGTNKVAVLGANSSVAGATTTYIVTNVADGNCNNAVSDTATLTVNPLPAATIAGGDKVCKDSVVKDVVFTASNGTAPYLITYSVNKDVAPEIQTGNGDSVSINARSSKAGTSTYKLVSVTDSLGCSADATGSVEVVVVNNPLAEFTLETDGTSILEPYVDIYESSINAVAWSWDFGDGNTSNSPDPEYHQYTDSGTYYINLVVANSLGCTDSVMHPVRVSIPALVFVPNAFTPNGDGINDTFMPKGDGLEAYELKVYDRWGNLIFISNDINEGWDGTANGGSEIAQLDSYVYVIDVTASETRHSYTYRGVVQMVK